MKLDKRQKIILVILVLLVIFLVWQILGLRSSTAKKPMPVKTIRKTEVISAPAPVVAPKTTAAAPTFTQPQLLPPQQVEYLQAVDQYQLAQIKRMLAEQIAATAVANQNAAKAKVETSKILSETPMNFGGAFAPQSTGPVSEPTEAALQPQTSATSIQTQTVSTGTPMGYQVVFIGNKEGRWSAILSKNNEYTIVAPGTVLPDQVTVMNINQNGVTLKFQDTTTTVPFQNTLVG